MAENDKEEVKEEEVKEEEVKEEEVKEEEVKEEEVKEAEVKETESVEDTKGKAEEKIEVYDNVNKNHPANKYELAIVAAQEARRMNETWNEEEEPKGARVTEKALKRARKGNVYYTVVDDQDS